MDVARLNFSHGIYEEHAAYIAAVRAAAERLGKRIPIIQDLSGPRGTTDDGHAYDEGKDTITAKDLADLDFGIAQGVEYVAQSYVGSAVDVVRLRDAIATRGGRTPVIAKIERAEAVARFDEILIAADAIMIARGDLGLAVPVEDIPLIERDIIQKCNAAHKPVIVATQMLYSMVDNPAPTRAEVTDEEYAIFLGTDAVMLSDETARGLYPVEAVAFMERIAARAEQEVPARDVCAL
jgi:pyruvate kinase